MLDEPDSFRLADETVEQFTELSAAHRAVVDARKQVEALRPLRAVDQELTRIGAESAEVSLLESHLDAWVWGHQLARAARGGIGRNAASRNWPASSPPPRPPGRPPTGRRWRPSGPTTAPAGPNSARCTTCGNAT